MSTPRVRPTREETRDRIITAAADVFAQHGVAGTSVEQIAVAAGFTRGAFYSNFSTKEELAVAMLEDHLAASRSHNDALLHRHADPAAFVDALRDDVGRDDPLHRNPLLQIELMLYVARTPELRPVLGQHLEAKRGLVGELAATTLRANGVDLGVESDQVGMVLVALEDGLRLHRLIDPDSTPADAFLDTLELLQRLMTQP